MKTAAKFIVLAFVALGFFSCSGGSSISKTKVTIHDVEYVTQNIHKTNMRDYKYDDPTSFISFWVSLKGSLITAADIKFVDYKAPDGVWWREDNQERMQSMFNEETQVFGGWQRYFSPEPSGNGSMLPIGIWKVVIKFRDGNSASKDFLVTAPGYADNNEGYTYMCNADYFETILPDWYVRMLPRPYIQNAFMTEENVLQVEFKVGDSRISNGSMYFFDADHNYVGSTKDSFITKAGVVNPYLNDGELFRVDRKLNIVKLENFNIDFKNKGDSLEDCHYLHVDVFDGKQFSSRGYYTSVSTSALVNIRK